jgi:DNA-binding response OmpR family regulator
MKKKILVVDDEEDIRNLAKQMLEMEGYEVIMASDGKEALSIAEKEAPDLILLDVVMPGMDGFEVCKILKSQQKTRSTPVVIFTVLDSEAHKKRGRDAGADGYAAKPFKIEALLAEVKRQIAKKRQNKLSGK